MATRSAPRCGVCRRTGHNRRTCDFVIDDVPESDSDSAMPFESDSCPICMDPLTKTGCCTTPCGHQFCLGCFIKAYRVKTMCPLCRDEMVTLLPVPLPVHVPVPYPPPLPLRNFNIVVENTGQRGIDLYWIKHSRPHDLLMPQLRLMHGNIAPLSRRTIHIGRVGDRFWLDTRRTHIPSMVDVNSMQRYIFCAAPHTTYLCNQTTLRQE